MRYQVPQYLEVEDKIFGPLTLKQFLFAAGGLGGAYALWSVLPSPIGAIVGILLAVFSAALGFGQMNGRPFLVMIESMISYTFSKKLFLWKKVPHPIAEKAGEASGESSAPVIPRLSESKLKSLAWGLDIQESLTSKIESREPAPNTSHQIPTIPPGVF